MLSYLQIPLALSVHPKLGLSLDDAISDQQELLPVKTGIETKSDDVLHKEKKCITQSKEFHCIFFVQTLDLECVINNLLFMLKNRISAGHSF